MKRLLILFILLLSLMQIKAIDNGTVKVKLKNGTAITGQIKSLAPLEKIVIVIAGLETTIPMSEVENIEMMQESSALPLSPTGKIDNLGYGKLLVTETKSYREVITINIENHPIEMIFVPGGRMNMGYDGDGSLSMNSEPIHQVALTSFYISRNPLPAWLATKIVGSKKVKGEGNELAEVNDYSNVDKIITEIIKQTGLDVRLPTEAEWEYAACSEQQYSIFEIGKGSKVAYEWCQDYWGEFENNGDIIIDPEGPKKGGQHVIRAYNAKRGKFDRSNEASGKCYEGLIRLAIKAVDVH